jgi:hypothetical protein
MSCLQALPASQYKEAFLALAHISTQYSSKLRLLNLRRTMTDHWLTWRCLFNNPKWLDYFITNDESETACKERSSRHQLLSGSARSWTNGCRTISRETFSGIAVSGHKFEPKTTRIWSRCARNTHLTGSRHGVRRKGDETNQTVMFRVVLWSIQAPSWRLSRRNVTLRKWADVKNVRNFTSTSTTRLYTVL